MLFVDSSSRNSKDASANNRACANHTLESAQEIITILVGSVCASAVKRKCDPGTKRLYG